jgi:PST family polysaccharide transporter
MKKDAFWSAVEAAAAGSLSLLSAFLVARLVGPEALGIGAAATAVNVILWVAVNALFADAIVQRPRLSDHEAAAAFWASCLVGTVAAAIQAAAGWVLARALDDPRLIPMALLLALPLPLVGGAGVIQGLLTRERAYRHLAMRTIVGQGLGSATGIAAALAGAGPWAIVAQQIVTTGCGALALLIGRGWLPAPRLDRRTLRDLLAVGLPLTGSTLVLIGRYRVFAILIGATAGSAVLGQVHIAFRMVDTVRDLTFTALWRLMLPALSPHQSDPPAMLENVDRWLRRGSIAVLPLCAALALGLTRIVPRIMGPAWDAAEHAALPLVALMAVSVLTFPSGVALVAAGGARYALYGNLAALILTCAGVVILPPENAWDAAMIWTVSQILVQPYMLHVNARALGVGLFRPIAGVIGLQPLTPASTVRN